MENNINIRFANIRDLDRIVEFIKINWNENHIFVKNIEILKYYHVIEDKFTFVVAEDIDCGEIYGICGYLQSNNNENSDLWTVIWKTIKSANVMLGIDILNFIKKETNCKIISSCGINAKTIPIYKFLGYYTGKLNHYYRLANKEKYSIAIVNNKRIESISDEDYATLIKIESIEELNEIFDFNKYKNRKPYKDSWYIKNRFYNHPLYKYIVFGIDKGEKNIKSILICREVISNNTKILRIVDFIGEEQELTEIAPSIQRIIQDNEYEYIDLYCYGIKTETMKKAGFVLKDETDINIIPNYFEPFEQENIDINFFTNDKEKFYMFKADGDQDRPSIVK